MNIADIVTPERVRYDNESHSKKAALEMLANLIARSDNSLTQNNVFDCLINREKLGSTGMGNGIAIPHGRAKHEHETVGAFIRLAEAVDYDAVDNQPVDLLFCLLVPEESTQEHLDMLATLATRFSDADFVKQLRNSDNAYDLYQLLTK